MVQSNIVIKQVKHWIDLIEQKLNRVEIFLEPATFNIVIEVFPTRNNKAYRGKEIQACTKLC